MRGSPRDNRVVDRRILRRRASGTWVAASAHCFRKGLSRVSFRWMSGRERGVHACCMPICCEAPDCGESALQRRGSLAKASALSVASNSHTTRCVKPSGMLYINPMSKREGRPSPEALLAAAKQDERGRLKIFLGAAPGVGKTYEMLLSAQAKRRE